MKGVRLAREGVFLAVACDPERWGFLQRTVSVKMLFAICFRLSVNARALDKMVPPESSVNCGGCEIGDSNTSQWKGHDVGREASPELTQNM